MSPPTERRAADNHDRRVALRYRPGYTGDIIPILATGFCLGFLVGMLAVGYVTARDLQTRCSLGESWRLLDGRTAECWVPHYGPKGDPQ